MPESLPTELPRLEQIVPHAGPMLLLSRIVAHDESGTSCELDLAEQTLFRRPDGRIPSWVALEYMAQCIAAHAGMIGFRAGEPPRIGYLLGTRRLRLLEPSLSGDGLLEVRARPLRGRPAAGAVTFACLLLEREAKEGERVIAEGNLSVKIERELGKQVGALT